MRIKASVWSMRAGVGLVLALTFSAAIAPPTSVADEPLDFNRHVRPLLADKCFACHGPDQEHREADLRFDRLDGAIESGVVVPGQPAASRMIQRITHSDADERMPPAKSGKALKPEEIALLTRWVSEGARAKPHWAYLAPERHPTPPTRLPTLNWIDAFLGASQEAAGATPVGAADRRTLARRLAFDLTGLPLPPEDIDRFVANPDPEAYEQLVDQLLDSPRYGERMAMFWLDLVRYADTVGYHGDQEHHASPYRDYVIDAFNRNLPFDQFTREQLAGDLLPDPSPDQRVATCYNRLLQTSHEGGVQPKEYLTIYAADRVRNVSAVWLGATIGCAQCHDHKYDPYTTRDFYSLAAFFADIDEERHLRGDGADQIPTRRAPEIAVLTRAEREQLAQLDAQLAALANASGDAVHAQKNALQAARDALQKRERKVMVTQALATPRTVRLLPRGNWLDESGPEVLPAVPAFLGQLDRAPRATRLDLANWLVDSKTGVGGLTARVWVNRLWYLFFGAGLSASLEDFGAQGEPPSQPELLDRLALELVDRHWNVKELVKLIVTSRAYRQWSHETPELTAQDPNNRLWARQGRWRLPAESIRDQALFASRLLVLDLGNTSARPYQPAGYYRHLNFPKREYSADTNSQQWRRGVYVHWQRQFLHPMLKSFDAPSREECTARRPRSNTPLAALVLLNDPTFVECARVLAHRALEQPNVADADRIRFAFRETTARQPDQVELERLQALLETARTWYQANPEAATELRKIGMAPTPEGIPAPELAAWTTVTRTLFNLSETITRE